MSNNEEKKVPLKTEPAAPEAARTEPAKAEPAKAEPAGAEKNRRMPSYMESGLEVAENKGHLSVLMRDDITRMWDGSKNTHEVPMPGFKQWRDPVDYICRNTYSIWDEKGMGKIYGHYKHNALVHTSDGITYGRDQVIANSIMKLAGYPDIKDYIDDVIWAPDGSGGFHTSMRWTWIAHNTGHTIYGPPTGKKVVVWGIANCYIKNDRGVEEWVTYNEISLIRQLGFNVEEAIEHSANIGKSARHETGTYGENVRLQGEFPPVEFGENNGRYSDIEYFVRKSYHDIYNYRLFNLFKENYAPNYLYHGPSDREIVGIGDFTQDQLNLFQAFPDLTIHVDDFYYMYDKTRDEYRTATRWTIVGTHIGFGIYGPGTGKHVYITGISHHLIRDGKMVEEWSIYDEMALRRNILMQRRKNEEASAKTQE